MAPAAAGHVAPPEPFFPRRPADGDPGLATYSPRPPESQRLLRFSMCAPLSRRRRPRGVAARRATWRARPSELSVPGDRRAMSQREGDVRRRKAQAFPRD